MKTLFVPFRETWETQDQRETIRNSASSRVRCDWVAKHIPSSTVWEKSQIGEAVPDDYDVYVFQKTLSRPFIEAATRLHSSNKIIIFDLCDAEWVKHPQSMTEIMKYTDYCTCSTEYIRQHLVKNYRRPTQLIVDRLDLSEYPKVKEHKDTDHPRVVWFGNRNTIHQVAMMQEALFEAYRQMPFTLVLISDLFDGYAVPGMEMPTEKITWTLKGATDAILSGDVVINPHDLTSDIGRAKSDNKNITAWGLGLPVVSHGNTHRLASLLLAYMRSRALRSGVGAIGRRMVEQLYDARISALELQHAIKEAVWTKKLN